MDGEREIDLPSESPSGRRILAVAGLLAIAAVWGLSFPTMKAALSVVSPYQLLAMRTLVGFAALLVVWFPHVLRSLRAGTVTATTAAGGALLGSFLAVGLLLQVVGLQTTTATKAGFITGLYVVMTPFGAAVLYRHRIRPEVGVAALLATTGLFLLTVGGLKDLLRPVTGDVLNLFAAVAFAAHVTVTADLTLRADLRMLCVIEAGVKALFFLPALWRLSLDQIANPAVLVAVGVTGIGATALGLVVQTWAQRFVSPSAAAVMLTSEPAFAGLFGFLLRGEVLSSKGLVGALAILIAMVMAARSADSVPTRERKEAEMSVTVGAPEGPIEGLEQPPLPARRMPNGGVARGEGGHEHRR